MIVRSSLASASLVLAGLSISVAVAACGSSDDSTFGNGTNENNASGGNNGFVPNDSSGGSPGGSSGTVGNVGSVTPGSACATSNAGATRPPAYLVFMYDRSISMDDKVGGTTKWAACKTGLENFFASSSSAGIRASLTFFGKDANASTADCSASSYTTPQVSMEALPDATNFKAALDATGPTTDTPTLAALQGALTYAGQVKAGVTDGGKVAVVLVTDGQPKNCTGNTITAVHDAAAAAASTIPTYVIGVGDTGNLNSIAEGGGTGTAIIVNTSSPAQVTTDLENALGQIANAQLGCEYGLPAPPAGQTLDVNAVNVDYTPNGGAQSTLAYSATCTDPNGWHYDSTSNPTQIIMCPTLCDTLKADKGGKVEIIFGCTTSVPPGGSLPK